MLTSSEWLSEYSLITFIAPCDGKNTERQWHCLASGGKGRCEWSIDRESEGSQESCAREGWELKGMSREAGLLQLVKRVLPHMCCVLLCYVSELSTLSKNVFFPIICCHQCNGMFYVTIDHIALPPWTAKKWVWVFSGNVKSWGSPWT